MAGVREGMTNAARTGADAASARFKSMFTSSADSPSSFATTVPSSNEANTLATAHSILN